MAEYFIYANSFAAPFFSDSDTAFQEGDTPSDALERFAAKYGHPAGLYAAIAYESADAYHKGAKPIATWLCNHEQAKQSLTPSTGGYSYLGHGPGDFEIDGVRHVIPEPKSGSVVAA